MANSWWQQLLQLQFDSSGNLLVSSASAAAAGSVNVTQVGGVAVLPYKQFSAETQLNATGTTAAQDVTQFNYLTYQYKVASIGTSIVVRMEGSVDGTNWFNLSPTNTDTTITANGTYAFIASGVALYRVRFNLVTITGGTPTVDVRLMAGS